MTNRALCAAAGEVIDRMVTVQYYMSGGGSSFTEKPTVVALYDASRALHDEPLTTTAATLLADRVSPGDFVFIGTGFPVPPVMIPEADGPLGAVTLAAALERAFNCRIVMLVDEPLVEQMPLLLRAAGLNVADSDEEFAPRRVRVISFTADAYEAVDQTESLIERYSPKAIVTIEKPGPNALGTIHNGSGIDMTRGVARLDVLTDMFMERGIAVIGIGDGGNELGMGNILETVHEVVPTGAGFEGCPGGVATVTKADVLIVASISNWGAHGLAAALAVLIGDPNILHTPEVEGRVQQASAFAGLVDPTTCLSDGFVDGVPERFHIAMVDGLNLAVGVRLAEFSRSKTFRESMKDSEGVQAWADRFALTPFAVEA